MKLQIVLIILISLFLFGCTEQIKYQCSDGSIVNSINLCSSKEYPECSTGAKTESKEIIKYQCYNNEIKDSINECLKPEEIIKYQCRDGNIKDELSLCPEYSNEKTNPSIYLTDFYLNNNSEWTLPYIISNVVHEGKYKFHIYEKLYDDSGHNLWEENSYIGISSGTCKHQNNCIINKRGIDYLRFAIEFNLNKYPQGKYTLEITIVDEISGLTSIIEEEISL